MSDSTSTLSNSGLQTPISAALQVLDLEKQRMNSIFGESVRTFSWESVSVTIPVPNGEKVILENSNGIVKAGEMLAIMGPSGCGKTTLLNVLARRASIPKSAVEGDVRVNGGPATLGTFRKISSFVEQEDALIGALTVTETLYFVARLSLSGTTTSAERRLHVEDLIQSFGLIEQANSLIGTPVRRGISGGQKRRVSAASSLISGPKILFLDEVTSGLDSVASFEVISYLKAVAKAKNLIVIASIHQPSSATFDLFDKLLLLSAGKTCYFGSVAAVPSYFQNLGFPLAIHQNPAEFLLDLTNTDFARNNEQAHTRLDDILAGWTEVGAAKLSADLRFTHARSTHLPLSITTRSKANMLLKPTILVHRSFIKSYRDLLTYWLRIAMYLGLAIMMGTVWLRLETTQDSIQPFINAIFFGSAFMSFMAVAYIPAFLEDRATFVKERANGLYGAAAFAMSNFIIGLPFLFLIAVLFSIVAYWLSNFTPNGAAFMRFVMWLYLDLVAAESLVVLVSSVFPIFVVALAITAFANGLWMSVGGFLVSPKILNVFWRYVFHYVDYQAYVFQGMMVNEFSRRTYSCDDGCHCMYQSELASQCLIPGTAVLQQYGYHTGKTGEWVGILIGIIAGLRILGWLALYLRKH